MKLGLKNKKVVVTGAGRGIGRAIALDLAKEGAKVAVISRTENDLKKVVLKMGGQSKGHYYVVADLTQPASPKKVMKDIGKNFGEVDILVNNIGDALGVRDPHCSIKVWRQIFRINLEVAIELNNLVIPRMLQRQWGRIVHIASTASLENNGPVTYCAAKAALLAYARSLGRIYAQEGLIISAVLPGVVIDEKNYWDVVLKERPEHAQRYLQERCPTKRFATPDEISGMVVYLCSERATFCQGSVVPVDGGQSRHYFMSG